MKKLVLSSLLLIASSSYAQTITITGSTVDISGRGEINILRLLQRGVTHVVCNTVREEVRKEAKCILDRRCYGIQQPDQKFEDVNYTCMATEERAIQKLKNLREAGLCN